MRQYQTVEKQTTEAIRIVCDCCGKEIKKEKEDYLEIEKTWGYFSEKDGCNTISIFVSIVMMYG